MAQLKTTKAFAVATAILLCGAALPLTGCTVTTEPAYAEVDTAPPNIETYPSTVYEGQTVYLYNDHWYYRHGDRWAYYRREPEYLTHQRTVVRRPAPPAPGRGYYAAPPVERREERREAPPAYPVR